MLVLSVATLACGPSARAPESISTDGRSTGGFYGTARGRMPDVAVLTELGRSLFFDTTLSASGRLSCASCHSPTHGWGPPNATTVQFGGISGNVPGLRAAPSLGYQQDIRPFTEHFVESDEDAADQGPAGGRDWDGRASSAHEQAAAPLLSQSEMANGDRATVVANLRRSPNAVTFVGAFGKNVLENTGAAWNALLLALEVFEQSPTDFYPYSSKYDAFLRGQAKLSVQETRGLLLFNDVRKGNCVRCHPSAMDHGAFPQFTDRGFVALGVPRNPRIPANADSMYFDLGLCGPLRTDLATRAEYCGLFKTPSLRNVALRPVFFHNGAFNTLEDVLRFYAQRDLSPTTFYQHDASGRLKEYDDLPPRYRSNVSHEAPFAPNVVGGPSFSDSEAADIIAFLRALTDGYVPAASTRRR
ncbi:MAG: cytochrome c peroxidase [Gemmatimonadaceae bacterium]